MWFLTFLVELELLHDWPTPILLLIDEPATFLHPSAQRAIAKLLGRLSSRFQIIYSTHSPFMLDWNFPQRIRLFKRDPVSRQTTIDNVPYRSGANEHIWDPLRDSLGITLGDVAVIGETNILVEGITDQVLIANASSVLETRDAPHLKLEKASIIPYGGQPVLEQLLTTIHSRGAKVVVVCDADRQGTAIRRYCAGAKVSVISVGDFASRAGAALAIEDLVPLEVYIEHVNVFYKDFPWFRPLDVNRIRQEILDISLGTYLEHAFQEELGESFSKMAIAVFLADQFPDLSTAALGGLPRLVEACVNALPS